MNCEKCNKDITEAVFVQVPCHMKTIKGVIKTVIHVVVCADCANNISHRMIGGVKVLGYAQ